MTNPKTFTNRDIEREADKLAKEWNNLGREKCYSTSCDKPATTAFVHGKRYFQYCRECADHMDKQELFPRWRGWERKTR